MARLTALLCFFVSGATALAYEVLWVRMLGLVFGATVLSVGCVLAAYMTGLGLGSWFWGPRADRTERPLRLYAQLELGAALGALCSPWLFELERLVYRALFSGGLSDFSVLSAARLVLCLPGMLWPTFLLGGTLPALTRFCTSSLARVGRSTGVLYGLNTLGATTGTLLTGFVLIPSLGVRGTLLSAVGANLAVALLAYALSLRLPPTPPCAAAPPDERPAAGSPTRAARIVWFGVALSGLAAMVYEVAWTRALIQFFGNSTYAFTAMLACFLVGIAVGAALAAGASDRARHPLAVFGLLQALIGLWAAAATPLIEWLPGLFLRAFEHSSGSFAAITALQCQASFLIMFPATVGMGAVFPLASRLSGPAVGGAGRSIAVPYAWNTLGTVVGAVIAGFLLLPRLGIELSVVLAASLNLIVAVVAVGADHSYLSRRRLVAVLAALGAAVCARLALVRLDPRVLSAGVYMYPEYFLSMARHQLTPREAMLLNKVRWYAEGYCSSLAILETHDGGLSLQTNGKTDASTGDLATQRALAHLPLLLKPDAREVLVVGLASGCTVGSVLTHPVERVDCVEIEPAMLHAARFFDRWNHQCLDDPRLTVVLQDARNYLMMAERTYDLITAEPTNPWIAGVNNLFTREYYRDCAARLAPDGLMCQWLPAYNFTTDELRAALRTFTEAFPHVSVWALPGLRTDFFAIGTFAPQILDAAAVRARLKGAVLADAGPVGLEDIWHLAGGLVMDDRAVQAFCAGAPLNTDDRPLLEFSIPRHLYQHATAGYTVLAAYTAGAESVVPVRPESVSDLLRDLGADPAAAWRMVGAALRPHHAADLTPASSERDVALLELELAEPAPGRLRLAPYPSDRWPASLRAEFGTTNPPLWLGPVQASVRWEPRSATTR